MVVCFREEEASKVLEETEKRVVEVKDRLDELEALKGTEVQDLKAELDRMHNDVKGVMKEKDNEVNDLQEKLADMTAMYNANMQETAQMKEDQSELAELRKFKTDVERMEKEQASVIEGQGKRIEYLEKQYKEEQVMRKRSAIHLSLYLLLWF